MILKSTVPVGTNAAVTARLGELTGRACDVASNPEFDEMRRRMRGPVIFDGRNLYDPARPSR